MALEACAETHRRISFLTLGLVGVAGIVYAFPAVAQWLVYDRDRILGGEIWRALTCPWVHFSLHHLVYDLVAFTIGAYWVENKNRTHFVVLLFLISIGTSLAELLFHPQMARFGGVSGLATGYLFYMALHYGHTSGVLRWGGWIVVWGLVAKVVGEAIVGGSLLPYPGETPFIAESLAHLVGIIMASVVFWGQGLTQTPRRTMFRLGCFFRRCRQAE